MPDQALFSAPFSFLGSIKEEFNVVLPTDFREVWSQDELKPDSQLVAWMCNPGARFVINDEVLNLFPNLRVIVTPSTGTNHIDVEACRAKGVAVYGLLDDRPTLDSITASAEFTFLLLLNALRRMDRSLIEVSEKRWRQREDDMRGNELYGKQVGLVGLGRIGSRIARWSTAFDAHVSYYDPYVENNVYTKKTLEDIYAESDVVCNCCVLTDETRGMIHAKFLNTLKPEAVLVNTSRGEVIVEQDLIDLIHSRDDVRVALDVLPGEVTNTHLDSELINLHQQGRIVITPHIAGATFESQTKPARGALNLLQAYLKETLV